MSLSEQTEFDELLRGEGESEVRKMVTIYEIRGQHKLLLLQLRQKFGDLPKAVTARIQGMETEEELEQISVRLLSANSLAELGLEENDSPPLH